MPNGKVEQILNGHMPYHSKLYAARRYTSDQGAIEKCLALWQVAEGGAVRIKPPHWENLFPILSPHQNPAPFTKRLHRVSRQSLFQHSRGDLALLRRVTDIAGVAQPGALRSCFRGQGFCREYEWRNQEYAGQQNQWIAPARAVRRLARAAICACHVVLSAEMPHWGAACTESGAISIDWSLKECRKKINC